MAFVIQSIHFNGTFLVLVPIKAIVLQQSNNNLSSVYESHKNNILDQQCLRKNSNIILEKAEEMYHSLGVDICPFTFSFLPESVAALG